MKYYISNNIRFVQGYGNLMEVPSSATHMASSAAHRYIIDHPDHEIVKLGKSTSKKKKDYVISTKKQFIGADGFTVVSDRKNARQFTSVEAAFNYLDNLPHINSLLNGAFVIDENYKKMRRPEDQRSRQEYLESRPGQRIRLSDETKKIVRGKSQYCAICGLPIEEDDFSIDHIVPLSLGGNNSAKNLQPVHKRCNTTKNNMTDKELFSHVTDIACFNIYNAPQSDLTDKFIRAIVRGTINNKVNLMNQTVSKSIRG